MRTRRDRRSTLDWIRATIEVLKTGITPALWLISGLAVIGVTIFRLATTPLPGEALVGVARFSGLFQLVVVLVLTYVLHRAAAQATPAFRFGMPLARFALLFVGLLIVAMLMLGLAGLLMPASARLADVWLAALAASTVASLVTLPLAPWQTALAVGDRTLGPAGGWQGLRGHFAGFLGAYLAIVTPFFAIHLALTLLLDDPQSTLAGTVLIGVVAVDSAASLGQLVLTVGLGVAAWTVARTRAATLRPTPSK
jgi:hypothetical protein